MKHFLRRYYHFVAIGVTLIAAIFVLCCVDSTPGRDDAFYVLLKKKNFVPYMNDIRWEGDELVMIPEYPSAFPKGQYVIYVRMFDTIKDQGVVLEAGYELDGKQKLDRIAIGQKNIYDLRLSEQSISEKELGDWMHTADKSRLKLDFCRIELFPGLGCVDNTNDLSGFEHRIGSVYSEQIIVRDGIPVEDRLQSNFVILEASAIDGLVASGLLTKNDVLVSNKETVSFNRYKVESWEELKADLRRSEQARAKKLLEEKKWEEQE